ncbi:uncharacterized protein LOC141673357 [Apium graveolens]|uniref:uncharacterized protein LOC141673357 n=1 Tax=Apium graveolens TaxID=4045 RepID=UPI003D7A0D0D
METEKSKEKSKENTVGLSYPMLTRGNYTVWALKMKASEKETSKEAWEAVKVLFQGEERVRTAKIQTLRSEFEAMSMKEGESLDDFCLKLNGTVTNIRALGDEMAEAYVVKKVLRAMPHKFLHITSAIEQFGDLEKMSIEEVIGSLKAYEERLRGQTESSGDTTQLLLTEEEWRKRDRQESKLLLMREEWIKRSNKNDGSSQKYREKDTVRSNRDKSKVRCWNCLGYGHFAIECKKPKREKELKEEVNMAQIPDD